MLNYDFVILSKFPNSDEIKDGMMQRVANIDSYFSNRQRTYLSINLRRNIFKKVRYVDNNIIEYRVNIIFHYFLISKILKNSKTIYIHSICNFIVLLPFLIFLKNKRITLDFHGVIPEELLYMNKYFHYKLYTFVENIAIRYSNHIIFVTKAMKDYILEKYKFNKFKAHVLGIFNLNAFKKVDNVEIEILKRSYGINQNDVVFIYSGGGQKWQNIDLMLSIIKKIQYKNNYKFIILTGEKEKFYKKLDDLGLANSKNIILNSVLPEELPKYYAIAHYGFVLRDKHILNRVSNPTKLVEYMWHGIVPIVKYEYLGDYKDFGYEYIKYTDINLNLNQIKSNKNKEIIKLINSKKFDMDSIINEDI